MIYNFRQNDIKNGGEGAPLTPIFHKLIVQIKKFRISNCILNIGGISNVTVLDENKKNKFLSRDIGPGNCLIDEWIRKNTKKNLIKMEKLQNLEKIDELILNQALDNFENIF